FEIISTQRQTSAARLETLRRAVVEGSGFEGPEDLAWKIITDATIFAAEAEVRWLDHVEERLTRHPAREMGLEIETQRPRRGRPLKTGPLAAGP
ncbi:MAG TPA: transcriptional regulator, partial [Microbacterium sp.]|nr:transcriptional regulator [Microbacterium sp.]